MFHMIDEAQDECLGEDRQYEFYLTPAKRQQLCGKEAELWG